MKIRQRSFWLNLFLGVGTALLALMLLLDGITSFMYLVLLPAIIGSYALAMLIMIFYRPGDGNEIQDVSFITRLRVRLSPVLAFVRTGWLLLMMLGLNAIWAGVIVFYTASGYPDKVDVFTDKFSLLVGAIDLIIVLRICVNLLYANRFNWAVMVIDGLLSLIMACALAAILLISPFDGMLPSYIVILLKMIVSVLFFIQLMGGISRLCGTFEFRQMEDADIL
ncbi:hypothetical protein CUJ83_04995 [Methanocella sp. CWC-04]|uniref:Uncharacterized protein n=1 Tax=Methanooceanicella nereidis TaxID=2052831 RepID=A0AAP2RBU3_9EURY|nr:hypothetical protein [Methanocella sp. CWC-04]MCD1294354.1 hypothetical protein [Methanocella sp. CWC-04]